jgi:hypothetical protein
MTTTEDRLHAALHARADLVRPEDLTHHSPPAAAGSLTRVRGSALWGLAAAAAVAAIAAPFVLGGPSQHAPHQSSHQPSHQPGLESPPPSHGSLGQQKPSVEVEVFYRRDRTDSLVARHVRVPVQGSATFTHALEIAAEEPTEKGLTAVAPAHAISHVDFEGSGRHGDFFLTLADRAWTRRPSGMGVVEARLAQRAVLCTVQSFGGLHGGHQPVHLYLRRGTPAGKHLFGVPLPPTREHAMHVDCS